MEYSRILVLQVGEENRAGEEGEQWLEQAEVADDVRLSTGLLNESVKPKSLAASSVVDDVEDEEDEGNDTTTAKGNNVRTVSSPCSPAASRLVTRPGEI